VGVVKVEWLKSEFDMGATLAENDAQLLVTLEQGDE